jgi:hypothetical protein
MDRASVFVYFARTKVHVFATKPADVSWVFGDHIGSYRTFHQGCTIDRAPGAAGAAKKVVYLIGRAYLIGESLSVQF